jgi:hypothetical protein
MAWGLQRSPLMLPQPLHADFLVHVRASINGIQGFKGTGARPLLPGSA